MKNWEKAEKKVAGGVQGRRTPGSGNGNIKGDILTKEWCIEVKETSREPMIFHLEWLRKLSSEALRMRRKAALVVEFHTGYNLCFIQTEEEATKTINSKSTISLRYKDLSSGDIIDTGYSHWKILDLSEFKEVVNNSNE